MKDKCTIHRYNKIVLGLLVTILFASCFSPDAPTQPAEIILPTAVPQFAAQAQPTPTAPRQQPEQPAYLDRVNFSPNQAKFYDLVTKELPLGQAEVDKLATNGFAVSDRWTWKRFLEAYAWIYWKDLPVLVTTDSLLHTIHQSYDDMLMELEASILIPMLRTILEQSASALASEQQQNQDPALAPLYEDLKTYLSTAQTLLDGGSGGYYVDAAIAANTLMDVNLFGGLHPIDFTLFKPRGHYTLDAIFENYFRSMTWLAQVDFRLLEFDEQTNEPILNSAQVAAAMLLRNALDKSGQRPRWSQFNAVIEALVGRSDNMTIFDFDRFVTDASLTDAKGALTADSARLLDLLMHNDYGQQRITGQIIYRHVGNSSDQPIPRPVSFMLMGQRFVIDSYITGNVVYDRVMKDGQPVPRAMPSPLDVMVALGNKRAKTHLASELAAYPYEESLDALRQQVEGAAPDFWQSSTYNRWLGMIRSLNTTTTAQNYPQSMRTAAWADKMLQTQLASWTQLRHDNILYAKQSFTTVMVTCEYPAGYVEPYPEFYAAMHDYARASHNALSAVQQSVALPGLNERVLPYFQRVMDVAQMLQGMAEKELRLEEFSAEEELFLRSIMVAKDVDVVGCGGPTFEDVWDGWYRGLFYAKDDNPALIADIHTNPTNDPSSPLYPPRVLHVATGPIVPVFFIVDTDEGTALYVGPAFSYYEITTQGDQSVPAPRLNDEEWRAQLDQGVSFPAPPDWTASFRLPTAHYPDTLQVPTSVNGFTLQEILEPPTPTQQPVSP